MIHDAVCRLHQARQYPNVHLDGNNLSLSDLRGSTHTSPTLSVFMFFVEVFFLRGNRNPLGAHSKTLSHPSSFSIRLPNPVTLIEGSRTSKGMFRGEKRHLAPSGLIEQRRLDDGKAEYSLHAQKQFEPQHFRREAINQPLQMVIQQECI